MIPTIFKGFIFTLALLLITGCSTGQEDDITQSVPEVLLVQIDSPDQVELTNNEPLLVQVQQGDEYVEDAEEVMFEIWKNEERDKGSLQEAQHTENGIYEINHSFEKDGIYIIQTHVTARGMHIMPKKMIIAGEVDQELIDAFLESGMTPTESDDSLHHHH